MHSWRGGDRKILGASWFVCLAYSVNFRPMRNLSKKKQGEYHLRNNTRGLSLATTCIGTLVYPQEHTHTHSYILCIIYIYVYTHSLSSVSLLLLSLTLTHTGTHKCIYRNTLINKGNSESLGEVSVLCLKQCGREGV